MTPTDQKILDLVEKHGFTLPAGFEWHIENMGLTRYWRQHGSVAQTQLPDAHIHAICAMHFAGEANAREHDMFDKRKPADPRAWSAWEDYNTALMDGDAAGVISALHEAYQ